MDNAYQEVNFNARTYNFRVDYTLLLSPLGCEHPPEHNSAAGHFMNSSKDAPRKGALLSQLAISHSIIAS